MWRRLSFPIVAVLAAAVATPQSQYDRHYGNPVDVTVADLVQGGAFYSNQAIRTHGRLEMLATGTGAGGTQGFALKDMLASIQISPAPDVAQEFDSDARFHLGTEVTITGVLLEVPVTTGSQFASGYVVEFWRYEVTPDRQKADIAKAKSMSIGDLVRIPGRFDGQMINVTGTFRGRNLFGDLPPKSERASGDWVLMDQDHAVWVVGKKPKGSGWAFDVSLKVDSGKWLEVIGRPETRGGITYIHAEQLKLSHAPDQSMTVEATPPPPERPKVPPVVVFALPLDGDPSVPGDSRFVVQFSKDMDETTFKGHVELRYLGPPRAGVRPLDSVSFTYDPGRRALTVDPGDHLWRGGELELRLLPGIKDLDGLELIRRDSALAPRSTASQSADQDIVDALHFRVGT